MHIMINHFSQLEQTYAHKILTGRRSLMHTLRQKDGVSANTSRSESEFDPFGAGHGCNSISAGLGSIFLLDSYSVCVVKNLLQLRLSLIVGLIIVCN